jgi:hypothetical protein
MPEEASPPTYTLLNPKRARVVSHPFATAPWSNAKLLNGQMTRVACCGRLPLALTLTALFRVAERWGDESERHPRRVRRAEREGTLGHAQPHTPRLLCCAAPVPGLHWLPG